jgi:hypothetical protein
MSSLWTTVCENLKHVPQRLPVLLRTGTDTYRRGQLISFASFEGDGEEESLFAAIRCMRPGVDPDMIYRHVFVRHMGRNVSLQDILINWSPELIRNLHLNTTQGTMPEPDDEAAAAAAAAAAAVKARWAAEASATSTSTSTSSATATATSTSTSTSTSTATSGNATGAAANATTTTATTNDGKSVATVAAESSAAAILRRLQIRHEALKAEYDLLVEAEAVQERTRALEQQITAKKVSLMG